MSEERINPFVPLDENGEPIGIEEPKKEDDVERINPFIVPEAGDQKPPELKKYLLLLTCQYPGEEEATQKWMFVEGRIEARFTLIGLIKEEVLDVHNSYIAIEGSKLSDDLPTVYTLFTDPRSSWSNSAAFGDNFNIEDYEYIVSEEEATGLSEFEMEELRRVNAAARNIPFTMVYPNTNTDGEDV